MEKSIPQNILIIWSYFPLFTLKEIERCIEELQKNHTFKDIFYSLARIVNFKKIPENLYIINIQGVYRLTDKDHRIYIFATDNFRNKKVWEIISNMMMVGGGFKEENKDKYVLLITDYKLKPRERMSSDFSLKNIFSAKKVIIYTNYEKGKNLALKLSKYLKLNIAFPFENKVDLESIIPLNFKIRASVYSK